MSMNEREFLDANVEAINLLLSTHPMTTETGTMIGRTRIRTWDRLERCEADDDSYLVCVSPCQASWGSTAAARILLPHIEDVLWVAGIRIYRDSGDDSWNAIAGKHKNYTFTAFCRADRWSVLSAALQHWYEKNKTRFIDTLPAFCVIEVDGVRWWKHTDIGGTAFFYREPLMDHTGIRDTKTMSSLIDDAKTVETLYPSSPKAKDGDA